MKMKKQLFYILGATATVATPVVAVVSCGSTKKNTEQHKETTNTQKPQVVVDTATHNQGTEIAGLPGVVSPEDLAAKAQAIDAQIKAAIASFDKAVLAMEEKIDADQEAEIQRRHEEHAKETSAYDAQFANPLKQEKIQTAEEISKHLAHEEEMTKQEAEEQTEYDELKAQQESAERQARHQAEIDAQNLIDFNNAADLEFESIKEVANHERHEAELLAQDAAIKAASDVSLSAHILVKAIEIHKAGALATPTQLESLKNLVSDLDNKIAMFIGENGEFEALKDSMSNVSRLIENIKLNAIPSGIPVPVATSQPVPEIYVQKTPEHNEQWKLGMTFHAGSFVNEFKTLLLSKFTADQLTRAEHNDIFGNAPASFFAYKNLGEIQAFIRSTLINYFPLLKNDINALTGDALFYAEHGGSNYGINFQLLNYLLNPENANKATFSEFTRAKWDQMGTYHSGATFEGHLIGQSNLGSWDNNNTYDNEIKNLLAKLDTQVAVNPNPTEYNASNFDEAVELFKMGTFENHTNEPAIKWIGETIGKQFGGEHGVKFQLISAHVDPTDASKAICQFTSIATWAVPKTFELTISGFKVSSAPAPHDFMNTLVQKWKDARITKIDYNSLTSARKILVNYLSSLGIKNAASMEKLVSLPTVGAAHPAGLISSFDQVSFGTYQAWFESRKADLKNDYLTAATAFVGAIQQL